MYFKKLEMHGFKSFAEPVTIEFNQGITCVVGPNGSGKSNISDAIRWVLGEQSPRMLRGGKMEEVIFSGTANRRSRGMAEVILTIDNEEGSLPIDYKEVAITRRMFRSGESEYLINGNQCRLRDIRQLIMDTGIGVEGYSVIGQGKIADIVSSKTESRREIFEEAAGIVTYRTKKAESERKLASTQANMDRIEDIIGELEGRIGGLKEDSEKAREYLDLKERYKELEINITLKNIDKLQLKNEYVKDDIMELQVKADDIAERKKGQDEQLASYTERSRSLEKESGEANEKLLRVIDEMNRAANREEIDRERLISIDADRERIEGEIKVLSEKKTEDEENLKDHSAEKTESDQKLSHQTELLDKKTTEYDKAAEDLALLEEQIDKYKNDVFEFYSTVNSGKAEISSLQRLQETLDKREETLAGERETGEGSNRDTLDRLNKIRSEKDKISEELDNMREEAREKNDESAALRQKKEELDENRNELKLTVGRLTSRMKTIEEMENNYEGYRQAVKYIMKSDLKGIHGVVADVITVPDGYETAIENALGASLENIICDDDESAKKAIHVLKTEKAGRLTFLPVSSVHGRSPGNDQASTMEGFIGFGPDCVEYDSQYKDIMEYLLGRVVLTDNMDNAVRMSKKISGFRFVTLDGEVINASGAITGGKYKNKTANILDRKKEINTLKNDIAVKTEAYEKAESEAEEAGKAADDISARIASLEDDIRREEYLLMSKENELSMAENDLKDIKERGGKLESEMENIRKEKENSRDMISRIEKEIEKDTAAIKETEAAIEQQTELYESKKDALEQSGEEITSARIAVNSLEKEAAHADSMMAVSKKAVEDTAKELESRETRMKELEEEKEAILSREGTNENSAEDKKTEKQNLERYIEEISQEKTEISEALEKLNGEKKELDEKLSSIQDQKYQMEIKSAKNETQLETYKNKLWDDFEVSYVQAMEFKNDEMVMSAAVKENRQIKERIKELGEVNVGAIEEYETVKERYDFLTGQRADVQEAMDSLNKIISEMDTTIKTRFKDSFDQIVTNFEEKFQELFGGGHGELRLSDENDPLGSDIDIVAQPPGKKLQNINLMSGGEKTLTAIALMFAVLKAKPTPFCILDEVEAALDDANIDRFINCLRKFDDIQFTLVTHQKATMEQADALYGVTMPEKGVSRVLSLSLEDDEFQYSLEGETADA